MQCDKIHICSNEVWTKSSNQIFEEIIGSYLESPGIRSPDIRSQPLNPKKVRKTQNNLTALKVAFRDAKQ